MQEITLMPASGLLLGDKEFPLFRSGKNRMFPDIY